MNRNLILYIALPLLVIACTFIFEMLVDGGLEITLSTSALYFIRMAVSIIPLASIVSSFTVFKDKSMLLLGILNISALLVVVDYYLNFGNEGSGNLLWLLPMIAVAYIMKYRTIVHPSLSK